MVYNVFETCMLVPHVSAANCAGWVQAWGSLIAICIAIWVPFALRQQELRQKRTGELTAAQIVAENVSLMLDPVVGIFMTFRRQIEERIEEQLTNQMLSPMFELLGSSPLPTEEQLLRLNALDLDIAKDLTRACSRAMQTHSLLRTLTMQNDRGYEQTLGQRKQLLICSKYAESLFIKVKRELKPHVAHQLIDISEDDRKPAPAAVAVNPH